MSPSRMLLLSHCMQSSLLSFRNSFFPVQMGCGSWATLWLGIKGRKQRLSEFATLPIIQMILNANYPPYREWPVTQAVACLCWALSQRVCQWSSRRLQYSSACCWTGRVGTQKSSFLCIYTSNVQFSGECYTSQQPLLFLFPSLACQLIITVSVM